MKRKNSRFTIVVYVIVAALVFVAVMAVIQGITSKNKKNETPTYTLQPEKETDSGSAGSEEGTGQTAGGETSQPDTSVSDGDEGGSDASAGNGKDAEDNNGNDNENGGDDADTSDDSGNSSDDADTPDDNGNSGSSGKSKDSKGSSNSSDATAAPDGASGQQDNGSAGSDTEEKPLSEYEATGEEFEISFDEFQ